MNGAVIAAPQQTNADGIPWADDGLIHFPRSSAWMTGDDGRLYRQEHAVESMLTEPVPMALAAGANTITLMSTGAGGASIDGIFLATGGGTHLLDGGSAKGMGMSHMDMVRASCQALGPPFTLRPAALPPHA